MPDGELRPFTTFAFRVSLQVAGQPDVVCAADFAECAGLEMSMTTKTIREGGNNCRPIHLAGPVSYGELTLKRGMSEDFGLWRWFREVQENPSLRASGEIAMLSSDVARVTDVRFEIEGCLPTKLKAPALSAKDGLIAIEEMTLAYEMLSLATP